MFICVGPCTLKHMCLDGMTFQPSAHLGGGAVGGTGVTIAPSARCLQIYFSLLVQGSTSQRPAKLPVAIATQPCWWPCFCQKRNCQLSRVRPLSDSYRWKFKPFNTWHLSIPVCKSHRVCVGPRKKLNVLLI